MTPPPVGSGVIYGIITSQYHIYSKIFLERNQHFFPTENVTKYCMEKVRQDPGIVYLVHILTHSYFLAFSSKRSDISILLSLYIISLTREDSLQEFDELKAFLSKIIGKSSGNPFIHVYGRDLVSLPCADQREGILW